MGAPATILHLSSSSGPGGAESVVARLATSLDAARYRSVTCLFRDGWLRHRCERAGVETQILPLKRRFDRRWLRSFARLVREREVSLIHAHEFGANTYGALAARMLGIPLIATVHGRSYYADRADRRWAYRVISHLATMVAVSEDVKRFLVEVTGAAAQRIRVVRNGIGVAAPVSRDQLRVQRSALGLAPTERVVGVVGSLYGVKGHRYLLEAGPRILATAPSTKFVIVGRGELEPELRAHATRLGLQDRVHFLGFREDARELLPMFDVFALPSLSEGLSIALLEAMAAGCPVVATNVGGNSELVSDGETGLLVPAADAPSLASAIGRLLNDEVEARRLGDNARCRVTVRFAAERMVGEYQAIYAGELERAGAGR
jgi:glycosyltransferase involved in cell wall biosynthesis